MKNMMTASTTGAMALFQAKAPEILPAITFVPSVHVSIQWAKRQIALFQYYD